MPITITVNRSVVPAPKARRRLSGDQQGLWSNRVDWLTRVCFDPAGRMMYLACAIALGVESNQFSIGRPSRVSVIRIRIGQCGAPATFHAPTGSKPG